MQLAHTSLIALQKLAVGLVNPDIHNLETHVFLSLLVTNTLVVQLTIVIIPILIQDNHVLHHPLVHLRKLVLFMQVHMWITDVHKAI